jgi:hypothetical protein
MRYNSLSDVSEEKKECESQPYQADHQESTRQRDRKGSHYLTGEIAATEGYQ